MTRPSVVNELEQLQLAVDLIKLGARLQLLEAHTTISRGRLRVLYREIKGEASPKGMLPFSPEWFLTWEPNIHSSLFMNIYRFLQLNTKVSGLELLTKSYQLYLEQSHNSGKTESSRYYDKVVLSLMRAWTMIRFFDHEILAMHHCTSCSGEFVVNAIDSKSGCLDHKYQCGLCNIPGRAGKYGKVRAGLQLLPEKSRMFDTASPEAGLISESHFELA
jgi:flagellar transcriptional activator FlhC